MSMTIVNGYACTCCDEVAKARRGEDPTSRPTDPPAVRDASRKPGDLANTPAVTFGGALAQTMSGANDPGATPLRPARVDLLA
jgi:hypothetical protein